MSGKNETPALIGAILMTVGLLGGGAWYAQSIGLLPGFNRNPSDTRSASEEASNPNPATINNPTDGNPTGSNPTGSNPTDFAQVENVPTGSFNYGGSTTFAPIRLVVDSALQTGRPEFRLQYVSPAEGAPSSTTGIKMLLNRQLDFSQSSRPVKEAEQALAQQLGTTLQEAPIAIDGIAIGVNPSLTLPGLTLEQLKGIYTGQIHNWQEVGGPDLPIVPISRPINSGGTVSNFQETVLGGNSFDPAVQFVDTTTQALQRLGTTPGGVYYASVPEVVPQCTIKTLAIGRTADHLVAPYREPSIRPDQCPAQRNQINEAVLQSGDYPLTRNLYVIWKQDNGRSQQAGQAYTALMQTQKAKALLLQAGFATLK
jgi:phosphate transport system substrate-binding protein